MKKIFIGIGVLIVLIFISITLKLCPPQGPWPTPPWCGGSSYHIGIPKISIPNFPSMPELPSLSGNKETSKNAPYAVNLTVEITANTPPNTQVYFESLKSDGETSSSRKMNDLGNNKWSITATFPAGELKYRYNRNNWGFTGAEELSPDSKTGHRTLNVTEKSQTINDTIKKWRWLPDSNFVMPSIPSLAGQVNFVSRVGQDEFQKGMEIVDFWWGNFKFLLDSTNERLKQDNVKWVEIAPAWDYKQVNPTPIITNQGFGNTYPDDSLGLHLSKTKNAGFKVYVASQVCCTSLNGASFSNEWWDAWFKQYDNYVTYFVTMANKYNVDELALTGDWFVMDKKPANYKERLEVIYSKAKQNFHGKLGRLMFLGGTNGNIDELYPKISDTPFLSGWDFFAVKLWTGLTTKDNPSQDELYASVKKIFNTRLKPLYDSYQKPIILSEVAYPSAKSGLTGKIGVDDSAIQMWNQYSDKYALDLVGQAMGHEAILKNVAETNYITGVYPFTFWPDDFSLSKEYNIRGKPAEEVLKKWYK